MKIYKHFIPVLKFDEIIKRKDDHFFLRLVGINIEGENISPIYLPFFSFARRAGQVVLELMGWQTRHIITIILQSAKPYIWIGHTDQVVMEDDDEY
jgi:hypothetical protein